MRKGSICLLGIDREEIDIYWDYTLNNIGADSIYVLDEKDKWSHRKSLRNAIEIKDISDLPDDHQIILLSPTTARFLPGTEPLTTFIHPVKAIYLFGLNHENLHNNIFKNRLYDNIIHIPTASDDQMFAHVVAFVTFYDRVIKNG